jgi:HAD superfamily hydrolase (TIGR01509 family)
MPTELVIFDCDGVLVDSEVLGNQVLVQFVAELGLDLKLEEAIALFRGCKMADSVAIVEQRLGQPTPPDFVNDLRARTAEAFRHELRPINGIEQALSKIHVPVCVASSGPLEKIRLALQVTGLLSRFDPHIFSSYEIGSWKPEPGLFLHASASMNVRPSACVVVEDSILGVRAAVAAGMKVFGYCTSSEAATFNAWGSHPFHAMSELPALLRQSAL